MRQTSRQHKDPPVSWVSGTTADQAAVTPPIRVRCRRAAQISADCASSRTGGRVAVGHSDRPMGLVVLWDQCPGNGLMRGDIDG